MAFVFDEVCDFEIPYRYFVSGSPYYRMVLLEGYVYTAVKVYDPQKEEYIEVDVASHPRMLVTSVRIPSERLLPGRVLCFLTSERVMPKIHLTSKYTLPVWTGVTSFGFHVWEWRVPS